MTACVALHAFGCACRATGELYINGIEQDSDADTTRSTDPSDNFHFNSDYAGNYPFSGNFDDIKVYNIAGHTQNH